MYFWTRNVSHSYNINQYEIMFFDLINSSFVFIFRYMACCYGFVGQTKCPKCSLCHLLDNSVCKITFHLTDLFYPAFFTVIPLCTALQNDLGCPFYEQIFLLIVLSDYRHSLSTRIERILDLDFVFLSLV